MLKQKPVYLLILAIILCAVTVACILGQSGNVSDPPNPVPPVASTFTCHEGVYTALESPQIVEGIRELGCTHIEFDYIWDGFYLIKGTKTVVENP